MSKVKDYEEKCLDELYTELDAQEEYRNQRYDEAIQTIVKIQDVIDDDLDYSDKVAYIRHICDKYYGRNN